MDGEQIVGIIIMTLISVGCGFSFYFIGMWAQKRKDPMHFYSGSTVDPRSISDIPAYNRENAKMWKLYSIPYFVTGVCSVASAFLSELMYVATAVLILGGTLGIVWLVFRYKKICNYYMIR